MEKEYPSIGTTYSRQQLLSLAQEKHDDVTMPIHPTNTTRKSPYSDKNMEHMQLISRGSHLPKQFEDHSILDVVEQEQMANERFFKQSKHFQQKKQIPSFRPSSNDNSLINTLQYSDSKHGTYTFIYILL